MGRFGGFMIARAGIRSLAQEIGNQVSENSAADEQGDAVKAAEDYQKAQTKEYSGITGYFREQAQQFHSDHQQFADAFNPLDAARDAYGEISSAVSAYEGGKGIGGAMSAAQNYKPESPSDQIKGLADSVAEAKAVEQHQREIEQGIKFQDKLQEHLGKQQDEVAIGAAGGALDKSALKDQYQYRNANQDADALANMNFQKAGFHSEKELQDAVTRERALAAQRYNQEMQQHDQEIGEKSQAMGAEGDEAKREDAGDYEGAKREKFMQGLDQKSQAAHKESSALGDQFDQQVKPELIKQYDDQVAAQRAADEQRTQDQITKIQSDAEKARLEAAGEGYQAERDAHMAALDDRVTAAQAAADREKDVVKKAQLQRVADATRSAAGVEGQAYDAGHDRQDRERATEMSLKDHGNTEEAELYEAGLQLKKDGDQKVYAERVAEAQYRAEQQQRDRDMAEKESAARAQGKGELASYEQLRGREQADIQAAERTGNSDRISQAKRVAANDIAAYEREHQQRGEKYDSTEAFSNSFMFLGGGNGLQDAMKLAKADSANLKGGGDLSDKTADRHMDASKALEAAAKEISAAVKSAAKFVVVDMI